MLRLREFIVFGGTLWLASEIPLQLGDTLLQFPHFGRHALAARYGERAPTADRRIRAADWKSPRCMAADADCVAAPG
ncbi:hypothetical protein SBA3_1270006 [Candidatus Sulfopaludibacter sp. SbA3]|nr:hypothetical protein SBA3_1270006 [Candidatus Sulfopaludibacter sp. SbA3]